MSDSTRVATSSYKVCRKNVSVFFNDSQMIMLFITKQDLDKSLHTKFYGGLQGFTDLNFLNGSLCLFITKQHLDLKFAYKML